MKTLQLNTARTVVILMMLFSSQVHAQLQNYEFGGGFHGKKNESEPGGWHMHQKLYGIMMRAHFSILDKIIDPAADNRFRFGDYLGGAFSTGYAVEKINPSGEIGDPETRSLKSMWISIDAQFGLQASYCIDSKMRVGINAFKEFQFGMVVMSDYLENIYAYNFIGGNFTYGPFYLEYNHGLPWHFVKDRDFTDHMSRFQFKFFTDKEEGKNFGIRFENGRRDWSGRTDQLTSIELCFGRMF